MGKENNVSAIQVTNRLHFSMCVYCNRSQMTLQRVKVKKVLHETKSNGVTVGVTHGRKCNLFVLYNKNSNGLLKDEKRKTSLPM